MRLSGSPAPTHPALLSALAAGAILYARAWMDLGLMGWMAWISTRVYQTQPWHTLPP
ncbi:hypothetical protein STIAU_3528 [Stigmatella aurantiaca DW4/3-1]|uniref:Uncharacterized protein n=1 Tax=Stigmatella aurantiaca (strain DW4/3-1) TaxID=378806 RepID=Q093V2_STIAD|nr:hypothetical protein STIAU_3528 [Stigmatella aurantiaca DW4/3-1]